MQKQCGLLGRIPAGSTVSPSGRRPCSAASVACCRRPGTVCSSSAGGACGTCPGTASCTKSGKSISARGRARVSAKSVRGVGGRAWGGPAEKVVCGSLGRGMAQAAEGSLREPGAAAVQLACRVPTSPELLLRLAPSRPSWAPGAASRAPARGFTSCCSSCAWPPCLPRARKAPAVLLPSAAAACTAAPQAGADGRWCLVLQLGSACRREAMRASRPLGAAAEPLVNAPASGRGGGDQPLVFARAHTVSLSHAYTGCTPTLCSARSSSAAAASRSH